MQKIEALDPGVVEQAYQLVPTTMNELGGNLPFGRYVNGTLQRGFRFKPPTVRLAKERSLLSKDAKISKYIPRLFAHWLGCSLAELCGEMMDGFKNSGEKADFVAQLCVADVLYLLIAWHKHARPRGFQIKDAVCEACGNEMSTTFDLGGVRVSVLPDDYDHAQPQMARVGLYTGFEYPRGQRVSTVLLQSPTWKDAFWDMSGESFTNAVEFQIAVVQAGIVGIDTSDMVKFPRGLIEEAYEEDLDMMSTALLNLTPSPILLVPVECPKCGTLTEHPINWQGQDFLSSFLK